MAAGLYFVTGEAYSHGRSTLEVVRLALDGGVRLIQLREKEKTTRELLQLAAAVRELCDRYDALLIINDRVDIALAVDADGVHLGNDDLAPAHARRLFPEGIIGVSTHCEAEATGLENRGASYFNIGPVFPTRTKSWDEAFLGVDRISSIAACCSLPFSVMGGIDLGNVKQVVDAGARTVAVVTAITRAPDPKLVCQRLLRIIRAE
ncbi:MAG: thiamine phosphate synthase [Deltaproteobacteria bacterium]|nr:thiamine phosphate synthase [Deltaproteobacteria bacterium]